jgi:hypothetical protein
VARRRHVLTTLIVDGAGGKTTPLAGEGAGVLAGRRRGRPPLRRRPATTFHGRFHDGAGELDFEYTLTR